MGDQVFEPLPGWPVEPEYVPEPRGYAQGGYGPGAMVRGHGPGVPPEVRYTRIENYYAAPPLPARRGPDPWSVIGWLMCGAVAAGVLLAVAVAAVAVAVAAAAVAVTVAVLYLLLSSKRG